ncbi:GNAT family N-acetyltransferase [Psychroserpens jangbogonensis]|uniref:GNAT family N-acetyltransferase n=1 Tax=Psychroserpens jangbogonensis TaxID=1484460 RepID=UPI00053E3FD6|nr:GNAT family N-acetyltransferase [Psychroserpens jangbogonensis]
MVEEQIPQCYVATTKENVTIYRQWLFTHKAQQQITDYFGPVFPEINKNEAIIEGIFTHPDYRGLRVMSNAMSQIVKQQQYKNLNRIIAFVEEENISSLKGFYRMGFTPYIIRQENWFLFKGNISFNQILDKVQNNYLNAPSYISFET